MECVGGDRHVVRVCGQERAARRRCACWVGCGCADTPPPLSFVCCRVRRNMFYKASSFNGDLSKWEVSGATDMGCVCVARGEQRGADACWVCGCADTLPATALIRVLPRAQ